MKEVAAIKEKLTSQIDTGTPQWDPSYKTDFAFADNSASPSGVLPDPSAPAPQGDASAAAPAAPATPGTTPQP